MQKSALQPGGRGRRPGPAAAGAPADASTAAGSTVPGGPAAGSTADEFWTRYGDAIDDRVAELLDDLLAERAASRAPRPRRLVLAAFGGAVTAAAVLASLALRDSEIAVCTVWALTGAACLAAALVAARRG